MGKIFMKLQYFRSISTKRYKAIRIIYFHLVFVQFGQRMSTIRPVRCQIAQM
jgi:hypothetical protein